MGLSIPLTQSLLLHGQMLKERMKSEIKQVILIGDDNTMLNTKWPMPNKEIRCHSREGGNPINGVGCVMSHCLLDPRLHGDDRKKDPHLSFGIGHSSGFSLIEMLIVMFVF